MLYSNPLFLTDSEWLIFANSELALYKWLLALVPVGVLPGIAYSLICIATDSDGTNTPMYKKRIKGALLFAAIAEGSLALLNLIYRYFI